MIIEFASEVSNLAWRVSQSQNGGAIFARTKWSPLFGSVVFDYQWCILIVMSVKSSFYNEYDIKNNEKPVFWAQRSFQNHHQTFHDRCPEKIGPLPKKSDRWSTRTCPENIRPAPTWSTAGSGVPGVRQKVHCSNQLISEINESLFKTLKWILKLFIQATWPLIIRLKHEIKKINLCLVNSSKVVNKTIHNMWSLYLVSVLPCWRLYINNHIPRYGSLFPFLSMTWLPYRLSQMNINH